MKIWSLQEDVNEYEHITLEDSSNEEWIKFDNMFHNNYLGDKWHPIKVCLIEHGDRLKRGDMPYLSPGKPTFSKKAVEVLGEFLYENVEILPIQYDLQELFIINVTNHIDAIDYDKADIKFMPDGKRILRVKRYSFKTDRIREQHIFKIASQLYGTVFVSDAFRDKAIESGLEGFNFIEVWDSEK